MRRLLLGAAAAVLAFGVPPVNAAASADASADADAATCGQAVQWPATLDRITIIWGTLLACGSPITSATFTGQLQVANGVPIDMRAGTIFPPGGQFYFWTHQTVCPLPGFYRSVILTVTIVLANGTTEQLLFQDSGFRFVDCIL